MKEAKVNTFDFPLSKPAALYPLWVEGRLREQGIKFADSNIGPFTAPTGNEVLARMLPPWDVSEDFEGVLHVRQGSPDAASSLQSKEK